MKLRQIESVNLDTLNVRFKNVLFSDELSPELAEKICEDESEKEEKIDYESALNLISEYKNKLTKEPSFSLYVLYHHFHLEEVAFLMDFILLQEMNW